VSLEPCDHHGRTPPCSQALIAAGVARVVVGALDPNPKTAQAGVRRLREAGIAVELADDAGARDLIERFSWTIVHDRPYVTLKMAMSLDGFVTSAPGIRHQLTGAAAQNRVRDLRIQHDAVMVGAGTVRIDDPLLTVRPHASRRSRTSASSCASTNRFPSPLGFCSRPSTRRRVRTADDRARAGRRARCVCRTGRARRCAVRRCKRRYRARPGGSAARASRARRRERPVRRRPTLAGRLLAARLVQRALWFVAPVFLRSDGAVPVLAGADLAGLDGWHFDGLEAVGDDMLISADLTTCSPD